MNITNVKVRKVSNTEGKMRGIASITIDESFVVRDIRIIEGQNGLFVAMPSRKTPDGEFRDIAHPITTEARQIIQNAILKEYGTLE
ncbi:MAG: septation regulator SpoVG [Bacillota bacterium]